MRSSAGNLNEMESKIAQLERANFDLKLRLHYLNNKYGGMTPMKGGNEDESGGHEKLSTLWEENEYSKRRIIELESEVLQLQLLREKEADQYQKALQLKPNTALHLEEQRKREREVSLAIAEHDAAIIQKLQEDIQSMQTEKDKQEEAYKSLQSTLDGKLKALIEKESEISSLRDQLRDAGHQLQTIQWEMSQMQQQTRPHGGGQPVVLTTQSNGAQTSIILSSSSNHANNNTTAMSSSSLPTAMVGTGRYTSSSIPSTTANSNRSNSFVVTTANGMQFTVDNHQALQSYQPAYTNQFQTQFQQPYHQQPQQQQQQPPQHHATGNAYNVYLENSILKEKLEALQSSIHQQDSIIAAMKTRSEEMNLMENEEIFRLEVEISKMTNKRDRYKAMVAKLEDDLEVAMTEILDRRREMIAAASAANNGKHQHHRHVVDDIDDGRGGRSGGGSGGQHGGGSLDVSIYEKTIDLYKQREAELLTALEGVVARCQELEQQQANATINKYRR